MRYVTTATLVVAGLLASAANAALQTSTMDALEAEVRTRHAALSDPINRTEKKLRRDYAKVLNQFDKVSTSRKADGRRIARIVKTLSVKRHRDDAPLQALLSSGVHDFMGELDAQMGDMDRAVELYREYLNFQVKWQDKPKKQSYK